MITYIAIIIDNHLQLFPFNNNNNYYFIYRLVVHVHDKFRRIYSERLYSGSLIVTRKDFPGY